jgi:hypothetical protein
MLEIRAVFELLGGWEVEEFLANGELAVDLVLREAEVGDVANVCSAVNLRVLRRWSYKKPTLWTAWSSCLASLSFPPGVSNWERSNVTRSAQSTCVDVSLCLSCYNGM